MSHSNNKYLAFVKTQPCINCGNPNSEPHHVIGLGMGAMGIKASDIHAVPLCRHCHNQVHQDTSEWAMPQIRWLIRTQDKAQEAGEL